MSAARSLPLPIADATKPGSVATAARDMKILAEADVRS
jgi:hypothetical protein